MSEIIFEISLPLDSDGFLRRECPLCNKQFKVEFTDEERKTVIQKEIENYLLQNDVIQKAEEPEEVDEIEYWCPYCGQVAKSNSWWTNEQLEYIQIFPYNYMAEIVNKQLKEWKRQFSRAGKGLISIKMNTKEMPYKDPWISPEIDDMTIVDLACCNLRIKLEDSWSDAYYCYKCGFPYS